MRSGDMDQDFLKIQMESLRLFLTASWPSFSRWDALRLFLGILLIYMVAGVIAAGLGSVLDVSRTATMFMWGTLGGVVQGCMWGWGSRGLVEATKREPFVTGGSEPSLPGG